MEYQTITKLLDTASDNVSGFITKKWIEVHDQSGNAENRYKLSKQIRLKTSMPQSDLCDSSNILLSKELLMPQMKILMLMIRNWLLKTMQHLLAAFQKLIIHLLIMDKT